jgi:hypothetical protein
MKDPDQAQHDETEAEPKEWTTPTLTPLDLADAEGGVNPGADGFGSSS